MPFKCLIECVHNIAHHLIARPVETITRGGCRGSIENGPIANVIFFVAIFWPLYVCVLKDAVILVRDIFKKLTRD